MRTPATRAITAMIRPSPLKLKSTRCIKPVSISQTPSSNFPSCLVGIFSSLRSVDQVPRAALAKSRERRLPALPDLASRPPRLHGGAQLGPCSQQIDALSAELELCRMDGMQGCEQRHGQLGRIVSAAITHT